MLAHEAEDAIDIDAARRDIGCDQGTGAAAKHFERTLPLGLSLVAADRASRDPVVTEMLGDLVGPACEDDRPGQLRIVEKLDEEIALAVRFDEQDRWFMRSAVFATESRRPRLNRQCCRSSLKKESLERG
jgi:hypothetical protein